MNSDPSFYYKLIDQARHDLHVPPKPGLLEHWHPAKLTAAALAISALIWIAAWLSLFLVG